MPIVTSLYINTLVGDECLYDAILWWLKIGTPRITNKILIYDSTRMSSNDENTVELIEIDYNGKEYVVDNNTKEVYEKINDIYEVVGRLVKAEPIRIKFTKTPEWTEEYEDIETITYKGVEYMANPKTRNVYLLNRELGDYEYVGRLLTTNPVIINLENTEDTEDTGDDMELEVIEFKGVKYIKDDTGNVYDSKKFEIIGTWKSEDNTIDFIPTRGFSNINNSCFIDSVLFALLYRNSKFVNRHILNKDIGKLRISNPEVIAALKKNQSELVRLYNWLHNLEQDENTSKVCVPFRKAYTQVTLGKDTGAFHNSDFESRMGDSAEFLFTLFNGFNVKTLTKETVSYGKDKTSDKLVEFKRHEESIAPIILVSAKETGTEYFKQREVSKDPFSVVSEMSEANSYLFEGLETLVKIEKVKTLLMYLQRKTRIPKAEKDRMNKRIAEVDPNSVNPMDIVDVEKIYTDIKRTINVKETREAERLYEENEDLTMLSIQLAELKQGYKREYTEKVDEVTYSGGGDYLVLSIDRSTSGSRELRRDKTPFNIQESITTPMGTRLDLEFVVVYTDSPKHYMCYFKSMEDDMWYLYNDVSKKLRMVGDGSFGAMKEESSSQCTLLFYSK